jgi:hypothetical protein
MDTYKKNTALQNCNLLAITDIKKFIDQGSISLEEFIQAGLDQDKVIQLKNHIQQIELTRRKELEEIEEKKRQEEVRKASEQHKNQLLDDVKNKKVGAEKIKNAINNDILSYRDLESLGLGNKMINSIKQFCRTDRVTRKTTIEDLPPMEEGRTDVYFIGVPGSGKSTMLAGLLKIANMKGKLLPDTYNNAGSVYQNQLITDLNKGVLPNATIAGSYNYVALSLKDDNEKQHPFNIVEIPGENYVSILNNGEVKEILNYINNSNRKILIFVIDSLVHDEQEREYNTQIDQNLAYTNILQMFEDHNILEHTDAVYLVANKFDAIIESRYPHDGREMGDLAMEFLDQNFLNFISNCKTVRQNSKNKFKIKTLPYSIGNVVYNNIMEDFNPDYSNTLINLLIHDSFVVKGGVSKVFQTS